MVSIPEAAYRQKCWKIVGKLISILDVPSRFRMVECLARTCPYTNVRSLLIDRMRREIVATWNMDRNALSDDTRQTFMSPRLREFLEGMIAGKSDRDMIECVDVYASALSAYRFLLVRDREVG